MSTKRNEIKKALQAMVDSAVADRMKALNRLPASNTNVEKASPISVVAKMAQDAYLKGAVYSDPKAGQDLKTKAAGVGGTTGAGAELSPDVAADFFIPMLAAKTFMLNSGALVLTGYGDSIAIPALDGLGSGAYLAEGSAGTDQDADTRQVTLESYRFQRSTTIAGKLIRNPVGQALEAVSDGLVRKTMADQEKAWLTGTASTGVAPAGIVNQVASGQSVAATADASNAELVADLIALMGRVHNAEVHKDGTEAFVMNSAVYHQLMARTNDIGQPLFPSLQGANPTLYGTKVYVSSGAGTNIIYGVFSTLAIGLSKGPELEVDQGVSDRKADIFQAWFNVVGDVKLCHSKGFAVITGAQAAYPGVEPVAEE